jgi:hypothetical protein
MGGQKVVNAQCSHCKADTLILGMYHRVFSIFGIPTIPYSKSYGLICGQCNTQYDINSYNIDLNDEHHRIKYSLWNFFGLGLIAALMIWAQFLSLEDKTKIEDYSKQPQIEDTIVFYNSKELYPYVYFKIVEIKKDKFIAKVSKYGYKKLYKAESAAENGKQEDFHEDAYVIPKADLKTLSIKKWIRKAPAKK